MLSISYESDGDLNCRQMFANQLLARAAAEKEIQEAKARTRAQRALADAQAQVKFFWTYPPDPLIVRTISLKPCSVSYIDMIHPVGALEVFFSPIFVTCHNKPCQLDVIVWAFKSTVMVFACKFYLHLSTFLSATGITADFCWSFLLFKFCYIIE